MPIQMVKDQLESNTAKPSYASVMLSQGELSAEEEDEIAWSALSLYTGGADTVGPNLCYLYVTDPHHSQSRLCYHSSWRWFSIQMLQTSCDRKWMRSQGEEGYLHLATDRRSHIYTLVSWKS